MTGMDDGKVILKKVITADEEEPDTAVSEKASPAASKKVIIADTELQEETAVPVLSDDIKMLVTSMIHKEGKAFAGFPSCGTTTGRKESCRAVRLRRRRALTRRRSRNWKRILPGSRR